MWPECYTSSSTRPNCFAPKPPPPPSTHRVHTLEFDSNFSASSSSSAFLLIRFYGIHASMGYFFMCGEFHRVWDIYLRVCRVKAKVITRYLVAARQTRDLTKKIWKRNIFVYSQAPQTQPIYRAFQHKLCTHTYEVLLYSKVATHHTQVTFFSKKHTHMFVCVKLPCRS